MWTQDEKGRVHTPLEPIVLVATLLMIPVLILESDATGGWQTFAYLANWIIWGIFTVELAVILYVADRKKAALRAHWLDVAIVALTVPAYGRWLGWGRFARFFRLLRFSSIIGRALQAEKRISSGDALRVAAILTLAFTVIAGAIQFAVDSEYDSLWDGVWWAVVTVTTVGYGDLYPKTVEGRIVAIGVMLIGIAFASLLTAAVAAKFVRSDAGDSDAELRASLARIEAELAEVRATLAHLTAETS